MRVRCGTKEVWWVNFVLAAARMQAHADYQRQYYPAIGSIIRLEELRDQCEFIAKSAANEEMVLDLVAMHRHFQTTDPRDKIYALMGIVFSAHFKPYAGIKIDYSMDTKEVYETFAMLALQNGPGLEILRYCHSPAVAMLPSWVPDWSLSTVEKPLPCRKNSIYKNEPWWLKRSPKKDEGEESAYPAFIEEGPGKGLQINNGLPGEVQLNTLPKAFADNCPPHTLATIKELMDSGRCVMASTNDPNEDEVISKDDPKQFDASEQRLVRRGEITTRQTTESRIKALLAGPVVRYSAAGETTSKIAIRKAAKTLEIEGIIFDVIDKIHEPFVDRVDSNWENSTHFMVAVGQCKQLAPLDYRGQNPYSSLKAREEAFWLTLLAGGQIMNNSEEMSIDKMPFHEWLPLIPTTWIPSSPQVTVVHTGRLKAAEDFKVAGSMVMIKKFRKTSLTVKEEYFKVD